MYFNFDNAQAFLQKITLDILDNKMKKVPNIDTYKADVAVTSYSGTSIGTQIRNVNGSEN